MLKRTSLWSTLFLVTTLAVGGWILSCNSSSSDTDTDASQYADFGSLLSSALPAGLKSGAAASAKVMADKIFDINTALSGDCAASYTNCPTASESGGGDSQMGEIIMKIWAMDYDNVCTAASETCFQCPDCNAGSGTWYRLPTMMVDDGANCATTDSSDLVSVNFGVDPCAFDSTVYGIDFSTCVDVAGTAYDISAIVPWYDSWGIPQNPEFSGFEAEGASDPGAGIYWSVVNSGETTGHYFLNVSSDWTYAGIKTRDATTGELDEFMYMGSGSPDYYEGAGEDRGWNMSAYAGDIATESNATTREVETYQSRSQGGNEYIQRTRIGATHAFAQSWTSTDGTLPETDAEVAAKKNNPSDTRCLEIGATVSASKYVPIADCVTAFGATDEADLNDDDNYRLKIFSKAKLEAQDFSVRPTTNTTNACLN